MFGRDELRRTEFHCDWVLPQERIEAGGGTLLFKEDHRLIAFGGNIREKDRERTEAVVLKLIELNQPQLRAAFEVNRLMLGQSISAFLSNQLHTAAPSAVIVADTHQRPRYACARAQELLSSGVRIGTDGRGRLADALGQPIPGIANAAMRARRKHQNARVEHISLAAGEGFGALNGFTMNVEVGKLAHTPISRALLGHENCVVVAFARELTLKERASTLQRQFNLTPAEAVVSSMLAEGESANEIVKRGGTTVFTVRNQTR
ncbi:MAG: hypothetical protein AAGJ74_08450 [Pseudomonadota bacterium]